MKSISDLDIQTRLMAEDFKNAIIPVLGEKLKSIYLYGSRARGDFKTDSDIDFLILADASREDLNGDYFDEINSEATDLLLKYGTFFSFVPENESYYYSHLNVSPFFKNVNTDKVVLYG